LQLALVELPFPRPQAQHARFFSLAEENGAPLPPKTELTWWSIIERRAYGCAFIQDGPHLRKPKPQYHNWFSLADQWTTSEGTCSWAWNCQQCQTITAAFVLTRQHGFLQKSTYLIRRKAPPH